MKEAIEKLKIIPKDYNFKYSKTIQKFKKVIKLVNIMDVKIEDIRKYSKIDYEETLKLIDELTFRGFSFSSNNKHTILPSFKINENEGYYINVKENLNRFNDINYSFMGLPNLNKLFEIDNDCFFNYIQLESFKYFNKNIDLNLLKKYFEELGFTLFPINNAKDINNKIIVTKDLYIKKFLESKNITTYGELSRLNKNELLLIKSTGPRRIEKFIKELEEKTIIIKPNNNFTASKKITELKLSKKFLKYCASNKFIYLFQINNLDFLILLLKQKITMSDIKTLLSQSIKNQSTEKIKEVNSFNGIMSEVKYNKTKDILVDVINNYKMKDIKQFDYKIFFKYRLTSDIAEDITKILVENNYIFHNEILPIYQFNKKKKVVDFFKKKSEQNILDEMTKDGIVYISDLVDTNLLKYVLNYADSTRLYDFIKKVFVIRQLEYFDFKSLKTIDKEIYEYLLDENINSLEEIDFMELFKKFDNKKFTNLINHIDKKYMGINFSLYIYKKLFELKQKEDVENILYRTIINNETLESIGTKMGVTKERIRQRRDKVKETFNEYVDFLANYLKDKYANQKYFDLNSLDEIYKDDDAIVIEELLKDKGLGYIEELDVFVFYKADQIIKIYNNIMQELGDIFDYSEQIENIDNILEEYDIDFLPIEYFEYFLKINDYKLINNIYCKKDTKVALFDYTMRKYYKNKFYIDDDFISGLINKIHKIFGKKLVFSENPHNIKSILLRDEDIILCGNNRYIHIINVKLNKHLMKNINKRLHDLLEEKENVFIKSLYEEYKEDLLKTTSIDNEIFLYGIIRHFYKEEFSFNRFNISKNSKNHYSKIEKIEKFVQKLNIPIKKEELQEKFDLSKDLINNIMEISENLYYCDKNTKIANINNLNLSKKLENKMLTKINESIKNGFVSTRNLYKNMELDFIEAGILDSDTLYNILKLKYNKDFNYKKPYIVRLDIDINKFDENYVRDKYFENYDYIYRDDFVKFIDEMQYKASVANNVIKQLQEYFFQIDIDTYIKPNSFKVTGEQLNEIREFLERKFENQAFIVLKEIEADMKKLPQINSYEWNQYFMKSIINEYLSDDYIEISREGISWKYYMPIFVKRNTEIESLNDLIIDLILKKNRKRFIDFDELRKILIQNNLIFKTIPRDFFRDDRIIFENNVIKIKE